MAKTICPYPGCTILTDIGRCVKHLGDEYSANPRRRQANKSFYNSKSWKLLRIAVLNDEPLCQIKHYCNGDPAREVDHIEPIECGGSQIDRHNLQSACKRCHSWKTVYIDMPKLKAAKESSNGRQEGIQSNQIIPAPHEQW